MQMTERGRCTHHNSSDLDLTAKFDNAVGRDAEELGRVECQIGQKDEQAIPPPPERGMSLGWPQLLATDKERGLHQIDSEVLDPALRQRAHDVRLVHKAIAHQHRMEALADLMND